MVQWIHDYVIRLYYRLFETFGRGTTMIFIAKVPSSKTIYLCLSFLLDNALSILWAIITSILHFKSTKRCRTCECMTSYDPWSTTISWIIGGQLFEPIRMVVHVYHVVEPIVDYRIDRLFSISDFAKEPSWLATWSSGSKLTLHRILKWWQCGLTSGDRFRLHCISDQGVSLIVRLLDMVLC